MKFPKYKIETDAYIGRNGVTDSKQEGDGKTPLGEFKLGKLLGIQPNVNNKNGLEYMQITKDMYWVDDNKSKYYNQLVNIQCVEKDWDSAEHLMDYLVQYKYLIEIRTNPSNIPNKGSAIFLHCTNHQPTAGCIATNRKVMKIIIESIDEQTKIVVCKKAN